MHINVLNIGLLLAWLLITTGAMLLNVGAGMVASGAVLAIFTLYVAHRFGVYGPAPKKTEDA